MLVSAIIKRVRTIVGDSGALQFEDTDIYQWINDATKECASDNQLLQKTATSTVVSGQADYALPTDILKLHSIKYDGNKIRLLNMQEADEQVSPDDDATGSPSVGYLWAGTLTLYPKPDNSTKSLQVLYTRTPQEVNDAADSIDLPVMYHRRIVDYCLAMVAEQDDDTERYMMKMQEFKTGVANLKDQGEWSEDGYPFIGVAVRDMGEGFFDGEY